MARPSFAAAWKTGRTEGAGLHLPRVILYCRKNWDPPHNAAGLALVSYLTTFYYATPAQQPQNGVARGEGIADRYTVVDKDRVGDSQMVLVMKLEAGSGESNNDQPLYLTV